MSYVIPPDEVFSAPRIPLVESQGAYTIPDFENLSFSEKEGMVGNYFRRPFPRKGLVYPEAIEANNNVKKNTVLLLSIFSPKKLFFHYIRMAEYNLRMHFLKHEFYCKFSREVWKLTHLFLRHIGVSDEYAYRMGKIVATLFQYEEGYRWRGQDLFGEVTKEELINHPWRTLNKIAKIFVRREKTEIHDRLISLVRLLSLALIIPKVRRAWKFALKEMEMENLVLDEADRWYALAQQEYDMEDRDIEDRFAEHRDIYNWHQIKLLKEHIINQQKNATS